MLGHGQCQHVRGEDLVRVIDRGDVALDRSRGVDHVVATAVLKYLEVIHLIDR